MSYENEFLTVDLIVKSSAETCGVDAFALSLIKAERQIRKLFTYLMFQFPAFSSSDYDGFRGVLADSKKVYFEGFVRGIDVVSRSVAASPMTFIPYCQANVIRTRSIPFPGRGYPKDGSTEWGRLCGG